MRGGGGGIDVSMTGGGLQWDQVGTRDFVRITGCLVLQLILEGCIDFVRCSGSPKKGKIFEFSRPKLFANT